MADRRLWAAIQAAEERIVRESGLITTRPDPDAWLTEVTGTTEPPPDTTPQWAHYDPADIVRAADMAIADLQQAMNARVATGRTLATDPGAYPPHLTTDTARQAHRNRIADELVLLDVVITALAGVRATAADERPRPVAPFPGPHLPAVTNLSPVELIALNVNRIKYPKETP